MLPAQARLRRPADFAATLRRGPDTARAARRTLVTHLAAAAVPSGPAVGRSGPRAGFVVSRAVGSAVVRNRVRRRLRHLVRDRLAALPGGCRLVVRALPPAAAADTATLSADLDSALAAMLRDLAGRRPELAGGRRDRAGQPPDRAGRRRDRADR